MAKQCSKGGTCDPQPDPNGDYEAGWVCTKCGVRITLDD